jgi:hypothetical protein
LEIYKTFEQFKQSKSITIVDYLNKLQLSWLIGQNYRKIKYSYDSLYKLLIFKQLKGIKFQTQLEHYLKKQKQERLKLGFDSIPNQRTISYFINNILDDESKKDIDFIVQKINEISEKFGIILDIKLLTPEKQNIKTKRTFHHKKNLKTKELSQLFKKRFSSVIDLNTNGNCIYSKNDFINLILHMCNTNDFAENGSYTIKKFRGRSARSSDPTSVDVYVSDNKSDWGRAVATGISSWQDTSSWQVVELAEEKNGQYVKVEVKDTEHFLDFLEWGGLSEPYLTIFDVYGDIAPDISDPYPANGSIGIGINPMLNITVSDPDGELMNISWNCNSSGSWQVFGTNNSVSNGTYHQVFSNASENGK